MQTCPTSEQCSQNAKVWEDEGHIGYAIWYPQMGGYVGKAIAVVDKQWTENERSRTGGCIDVYVWHDGEFPFGGEGERTRPVELHHCDPEQFVEFGQTLTKLNAMGKVEEEGQ